MANEKPSVSVEGQICLMILLFIMFMMNVSSCLGVSVLNDEVRSLQYENRDQWRAIEKLEK